jgi:DNA replication ATP-dependent helicase Dna2
MVEALQSTVMLTCQHYRVKAVFVNTDLVPAFEVRKGDRINNPIEAEIAHQLVEGFLHCGIDDRSIGVISVYRSQIKLIQNLLRNRPSVEMHTTDKFQGRDKEIVIISLVRSNDDQNVGELLRDWRRVNVAFTRARTKLIVLGSKRTLIANELLEKFVSLMEMREWVYDLPSNAQHKHHIPLFSSQVPDQAKAKEKERENKSLVEGLRVPGKRVDGRKALVEGRRDFLGSRPMLQDVINQVL